MVLSENTEAVKLRLSVVSMHVHRYLQFRNVPKDLSYPVELSDGS